MPDLIVALGSEDSLVRPVAVEALGAVGPGAKAALPALKQMAAGDPKNGLRGKAARAVERIEGKKN